MTARSYFYPRPPRGGRLVDHILHHPLHRISIHALREEGDGFPTGAGLSIIYFYPRPPRGGRRIFFTSINDAGQDFYPRPPRGGRLGAPVWILAKPDFYPRPPRGGRHLHRYAAPRMMSFLSTPSARRATISAPPHSTSSGISIHALREEGDHWQTSSDLLRQEISIHALREEGDIFHRFYKIIWKNFYPRPPRGGRQPNSF